jgi:hypothetical protein
MSEFERDEVYDRKHNLVVLQRVESDRALVKTNRLLLMVVFGLMVLVFLLGWVVLPRQHVLEQMGRSQGSAVYAAQNPVLSAEISALKGQMFGLVSGSIESKLRSLEDTIRRGSLTDSLETLQDLKGEVKLLSSYSAIKPEQAVVDQTVIHELSELKSLIYLTVVSCGLMLAALAGLWLRHRYRLTHHRVAKGYLSRDS